MGISRQALLQFLREECEERGAIVVYLRGGKVNYCGELSGAPAAKTTHQLASSGSLFTRVKSWLISEREDRSQAALDVKCDATPPTTAAMATPPPPLPAKPAPAPVAS